MRYVLAIDVGGTFIKSALLDEDLKIIERAVDDTPLSDSSGMDVAEKISEIYARYQESAPDKKISALGFATPGACDENLGIVYWAGNLAWKNVPIRQLVSEKLNIPVAFGHDVRSALLAEVRAGGARDTENAIVIPIGTGIAAAFLISGEIQSNGGFIGEIGHLNVGHNRKCVCDRIGCLEAIASASAISNHYFELTNLRKNSAEILLASKNGDQIAQEVWSAAILGLTNALEALITILAPDKIVIGGGVSKAEEDLFTPLRTEIKKRLTFQKEPEILPAFFGSESGLMGTAILALDLLK
jgi:glucokinase